MKIAHLLPAAARQQMKNWCSKGGKAGSKQDKIRAVRSRWAKARAKQRNETNPGKTLDP